MVGVALALLGAGFGLWLILIGVGIGALGLGGIVREQRARGTNAARRRHAMSTAAPTLARLLGSWQLDPGVLAVCAATAALYGSGVVRSPKHWPLWRTAAFHGWSARADDGAAIGNRSLFR